MNALKLWQIGEISIKAIFQLYTFFPLHNINIQKH